MKQKLTKKQDSDMLGKESSYAKLHATELRVQRLERIVEGLLFWKDGSLPYEEAKYEYINDYVEGE